MNFIPAPTGMLFTFYFRLWTLDLILVPAPKSQKRRLDTKAPTSQTAGRGTNPCLPECSGRQFTQDIVYQQF